MEGKTNTSYKREKMNALWKMCSHLFVKCVEGNEQVNNSDNVHSEICEMFSSVHGYMYTHIQRTSLLSALIWSAHSTYELCIWNHSPIFVIILCKKKIVQTFSEQKQV